MFSEKKSFIKKFFLSNLVKATNYIVAIIC